MPMTPRPSPGGKMGRPAEVEVGNWSRFTDPSTADGSRCGLSTCGLLRWFASCSARVPVLRLLALLAIVCLLGARSRDARADGSVPPATELPPVLSMAEALQIFRARGLDLL